MQPKLRSDLIVSPQGDSFVVKDPATGRFFRFGEVEHFIARQADGSTPAEVIRQRTEERFQAPLAPASVKDVHREAPAARAPGDGSAGVLEHVEDLRLKGHGELADLVQEERPLVG